MQEILNAEAPDLVVFTGSLAFFHIPLPEYNDLWGFHGVSTLAMALILKGWDVRESTPVCSMLSGKEAM